MHGLQRRLQPWRTETFTFSGDPELDAKIRDVVGLCRDGPSFVVGTQDSRAVGSDDSIATGIRSSELLVSRVATVFTVSGARQ